MSITQIRMKFIHSFMNAVFFLATFLTFHFLLMYQTIAFRMCMRHATHWYQLFVICKQYYYEINNENKPQTFIERDDGFIPLGIVKNVMAKKGLSEQVDM